MKCAGPGLAALLALLLGAGCRSGPPTIGDPAPRLSDSAQEKAYRKILDRYSATAEIYSGFDTQLFAGATFQSWPFRQARVQRLARFQAMTEAEIQQRLAEEKAEYDQFYVFDLGTFTQDPKFDDFDTRSSIWRIALVSGSGDVLPAEIQRVGRVNQNVRALYPYMGEFWVEYRVKFPKVRPDGTPVLPEAEDRVLLRVASTLGRADLPTAAR